MSGVGSPPALIPGPPPPLQSYHAGMEVKTFLS